MKMVVLKFIFWTFSTSALLVFSFSLLKSYERPVVGTLLNPLVEAKSYQLINDTQQPTVDPNITPTQDYRVAVLKKFFHDYNLPLTGQEEYIVQQADLNGIDYALIPAISMQESGGCKNIPSDSFNCWGFGIYGKTVTRFKSFKESIAAVSKSIKEAYIKNGLTNATLVEDRWTPSSKGTWSYAVNYYIGKIRDYEKKITAS
ncbi:hypothetical protein M1271_07425 [Patescibacteria group bacterium]|nr:hypothetical protein [Patescibacteria group bacterium]MCL5797415.1 hypothetical protein [Patescibacteria group bacterium]